MKRSLKIEARDNLEVVYKHVDKNMKISLGLTDLKLDSVSNDTMRNLVL